MTKSAFTTLWFSIGGLFATWLAVSPNTTTPGDLSSASVTRAPLRDFFTEDLGAREAELRQHLGVPFQPSTRNPFQFGKLVAAPSSRRPTAEIVAQPVPSRPSVNLAGIAERNTPRGPTHMAIINADGQLYLVTEGELVAGRFHVVSVESDAVVLRDESGAVTRLVLR